MAKKKEEIQDENIPKEIVTEIPSFDSDDWSDYVLSQLREDEKFNNHPTVDGLRRLTNKLVGPIVYTRARVIAAPSNENEQRATVEYKIRVKTTLIPNEVNGKIYPTYLNYTAAADAYWGNTNGKEFARHPVAIAETRAEGRALRKLLRLHKVVTADEIGEGENIVEGAEPISDTQIQFIQVMCSKTKLDLDVEKFVKSEYPKATSLNSLTKEQSHKLQEKFNEYQTNLESIPSEIKGYKEWAI